MIEQNESSFFCCLLQLSLSRVFERKEQKTNLVKQSHFSPQSVHLCLLSLRSPASQKTLIIIAIEIGGWVTSANSGISESDSLAERVYFSSKVKRNAPQSQGQGTVWFEKGMTLPPY